MPDLSGPPPTSGQAGLLLGFIGFAGRSSGENPSFSYKFALTGRRASGKLFLEGHPKVEKVYYPGLESSPSHGLAAKLFVDGRCGGMLSADIAGGEQGASALIRECSTIKFVPSLASFATTISYPAKTSHRAYSPEDMKAAGISMGQLRFSIGLEDAEDIIAELDEALEKV